MKKIFLLILIFCAVLINAQQITTRMFIQMLKNNYSNLLKDDYNTIIVSPNGFYKTIQSAINQAVAGQQVRVMPGEYSESITLKDNVELYFEKGARLVLREDSITCGAGSNFKISGAGDFIVRQNRVSTSYIVICRNNFEFTANKFVCYDTISHNLFYGIGATNYINVKILDSLVYTPKGSYPKALAKIEGAANISIEAKNIVCYVLIDSYYGNTTTIKNSNIYAYSSGASWTQLIIATGSTPALKYAPRITIENSKITLDTIMVLLRTNDTDNDSARFYNLSNVKVYSNTSGNLFYNSSSSQPSLVWLNNCSFYNKQNVNLFNGGSKIYLYCSGHNVSNVELGITPKVYSDSIYIRSNFTLPNRW